LNASEPQSPFDASQVLGQFYETGAPSLRECTLSYLHMDERDSSVTLGFDTRQLPSLPDQEWNERPYNRFEFYLVFSGVVDLRINKWTDAEAREIDISAEPGALISVSLGREGSGVTFRASSTRLAHTRVYLATESL
jgi:hypothetical protein